MIRAQIQFTEMQLAALRQLSVKTGRSIADLTRDAVDQFLSQHQGETHSLAIERALSVIGAFSSGSRDGSSAHDEHLGEAFL
jgi:hypothetical protein